MKTSRKKHSTSKGKRPKNVWNAVRKLDGYLRKADIQAGIFMDSLHELRASALFEVRTELVQKLSATVNGDLLHAMFEQRRRIEAGQDRGNIEENAIVLGTLEALEQCLDLTPYRMDGQRLAVSRGSLREYDFDGYPEALDDEAHERLEVEVLRCGLLIPDQVEPPFRRKPNPDSGANRTP